ncbi:hypothetical protein CRG98_021799, partial [Punica granatum]
MSPDWFSKQLDAPGSPAPWKRKIIGPTTLPGWVYVRPVHEFMHSSSISLRFELSELPRKHPRHLTSVSDRPRLFLLLPLPSSMEALEAQFPESGEGGEDTEPSAPNQPEDSSPSPPPPLEPEGDTSLAPESGAEPPLEPAEGFDSMPEPLSDDLSSDEPPSEDPEKPPKRQKIAADDDPALPQESEDANGNHGEALEGSGARSSGASSKKSKKKSNNLW